MHQYMENHALNILWEFAYMPNLLFFDLEGFMKDADDEAIRLISSEHLEVLIALHEDLKAYGSEIRDFYIESELSFFSLLSDALPLDTTVDFTLADYLKRSLLAPRETLLPKLLYSCLTKGHFIRNDATLMAQALAMATDFSQLMHWLNSSEYSKETRWRILQFAQDLEGELRRFLALVNQLEPIFERHYAPYRETLEGDLRDLLKRLEANGPTPFATLTDGVLSDNLLPDGPVVLLLSYFHPFQISLHISTPVPILTWGNAIEHFLAYQQKLKENALNDHVRLFKNLGDKTRFQVAHLVSQGTTATKAIADALGVTPATVSYHLNHLVNAKILKLETIDGKIQYRLNGASLLDTFEAVKGLFQLTS